MRRFKWKCLSQLLDDPTTRRMLRDVDMQDASTIVADDEEAVELCLATIKSAFEINNIKKGMSQCCTQCGLAK